MAELIISEVSKPADLSPLALAINVVVGLPVTLRSLRSPGVRVERGAVLDESYTGPVLEEVLGTGRAVRKIPESGPYRGVPVSVAPIRGPDGGVIAALGVVDVIGTVDLPEVFGAYTEVVRQVSGSR